MSSSSYSALLRRSKLATYSPAIDQVYSTTGGHAARSQFGFKRPLPSATTKKAPFVRVTSLDNSQKRTEFRKATKESSFTKKWAEVPVGIQMSSRDVGYSAASAALSLAEASEVQSRFVPPSQGAGAIKGVAEAKAAAETRRTAPNFFLMEEEQFQRFLESLGERRAEFEQFALEELNKTQEGREATEVDLYEHAQMNPTHLIRLVERFLAFPETSPDALPLPHPHPTLALQYSTPTPLESALAPPIPGRLLGPSTSRSSSSSTRSNYSLLHTSILGQISSIGQMQSGGASSTTFFPDASGHRSNQPGRTTFTLKPTVDPSAYASRVTLASRRGKVPFRSFIPSYEPQALASNVLDLHPTVSTAPPRPLPGTQEYSGQFPEDRSNKRTAFGSKSAVSLTELMGQFGSSRRLKEPRNDLWGPRRSYDEKEVRRNQSNALREERLATDGKAFGVRGTREAREARKTAQSKKGAAGKGGNAQLVSSLTQLLGQAE